MMSKFIQVTGHNSNNHGFVNVDGIKHFQIADDLTYTVIEFAGSSGYVRETPEEIAAMIKKAKDEQMRLDFIQSALTGICANITVNDMTTDHRSLCIDAVQIGNAMMEVLKND